MWISERRFWLWFLFVLILSLGSWASLQAEESTASGPYQKGAWYSAEQRNEIHFLLMGNEKELQQWEIRQQVWLDQLEMFERILNSLPEELKASVNEIEKFEQYWTNQMEEERRKHLIEKWLIAVAALLIGGGIGAGSAALANAF